MQAGRKVLGAATGKFPDNASIFIDNSNNRDEWLYVENRCSCPLFATYTAPQSDMFVSYGLQIPALSLACVPIESDMDVWLTLGGYDGTMSKRGRSQGANDAGMVAVNNVSSSGKGRTVLWQTGGNGSYFSTPLYPLERCVHLSRGVTMATLTTTQHFFDGSGVLDMFDVSAAPSVAKQRPVLNDVACMAMQVFILALGATSVSSDITALVANNDVEFFGSSAAAANVPAASSIVPVHGITEVLLKNSGTATVTFIIHYWIGIPAELVV